MSLIPFPSTPDSGLPPARQALVRHLAEKSGTSDKIAKIKASRDSLAANLNVVDNAEATIDRLLDEDAQTLLDRLLSGVGAALGSFGGRAAAMSAKVNASKHQAEVGRRTIAAMDAEVQRLEGHAADLDARTPDMVKGAVAEAFSSLYADWSSILADMHRSMVMIAGLHKFLAREDHNYIPDTRIIATLPAFGGAGEEVIAHSVEIGKAEAAFQAFAVALERDPKARLLSKSRSATRSTSSAMTSSARASAGPPIRRSCSPNP